MKRCSIWAAVLSASVAVPFAGCSHMPTAMLPSSAREKVLDSKMVVAQDLENKKEFEKAKKAYESIHKADPKHARACHRLAIVSYRLGEREKSVEYFKKGQELTPENSELLSDYGYALYKLKQYSQAEDVLKKSVKLDPKSERAITRLATVYGIQGKMKESYTELRKISSPAEAHEIVAHLHSERGEKQLALSHYQKSLAISKMEVSGKGDLKKGSKAYKLNEQLLKRVEQNVAHLSSDPTLKSTQSKMQMVNHSQQKKRELTASRREKDLFRKPVEKTAKKNTRKTPEIEVAETKGSPFRNIRERLGKQQPNQKVENPFLTDPKLAESAFEEPKMELAKTQETKTKAKQKIVELDELLAQTKSRPEVKEEVTFRRLTDEDVKTVERSIKKEKQTAEVTRAVQVARVDTKPVQKKTKKRSAYELMRELQYELIADFTPPEKELTIEEQPKFQLVQQSVPQFETAPQGGELQNPFVNQNQQMPVQSPFEGRTVQLGKWKSVGPGVKSPEQKQQVSTVSRQIEVQPVVQTKKTFVQNAIVSQPKPKVTEPMTAVDLCPDATGEVLDLVKQLDAPDVPMLKQSIQRLGAMESEAMAAVPALRSLTLHENMAVRIQCAFSLWKIEGNTDDSIPTLVEAMNSFVESDRSFAAAVLSQIGTQSQELTPILVRSLSDRNEYVRLHTAELLARNSEWHSQANKTLADCVISNDVNIRWLATYSLADLKSQDDRVIAALSIALQDKASQVRAGAAYALGEIGPYAHKAIPELQKARFDSNSDVRVAAKNALTRVRRVSPPSAN